MNSKMLKVKEVAAFLQVSKIQVYRLFELEENPLPYYKVGRRSRRVSADELNLWLSSNKK
jgi:excisionase family DNA binding protein